MMEDTTIVEGRDGVAHKSKHEVWKISGTPTSKSLLSTVGYFAFYGNLFRIRYFVLIKQSSRLHGISTSEVPTESMIDI